MTGIEELSVELRQEIGANVGMVQFSNLPTSSIQLDFKDFVHLRAVSTYFRLAFDPLFFSVLVIPSDGLFARETAQTLEAIASGVSGWWLGNDTDNPQNRWLSQEL